MPLEDARGEADAPESLPEGPDEDGSDIEGLVQPLGDPECAGLGDADLESLIVDPVAQPVSGEPP